MLALGVPHPVLASEYASDFIYVYRIVFISEFISEFANVNTSEYTSEFLKKAFSDAVLGISPAIPATFCYVSTCKA